MKIGARVGDLNSSTGKRNYTSSLFFELNFEERQLLSVWSTSISISDFNSCTSLFPDKPQFQPGNFPHELEEGRPATLNLTARANPGVIKYTWTKETEEGREREIGTDERVSVINGVVIFSEVRRDDAGIYRVTAENAEGAAQTKIEVKVFYPPR